MSDIGIGTLGGSGQVDDSFSSTALQSLDKDAFLQLLVAQMQYQNPLSPVDSNEYLAQAAQYASVEQLENMAESQAELRSMQMVTIATGLVGQEVTAVDDFTGELITGTVDVVRFGTEPILIVDGYEVPLTSVVSVTASGAEDEPSTAPDPGGEPTTDATTVPTGEPTTDAATDPGGNPTTDHGTTEVNVDPTETDDDATADRTPAGDDLPTSQPDSTPIPIGVT